MVWPHEDELPRLRAQIVSLRERYKKGTIDEDLFFSLLDDLRSEEKALVKSREAFIIEHAEPVVEHTGWLAPYFDAQDSLLSAEHGQKVAIVRREVERVVVSKGIRGNGNKGVAYQDRLSITFRDGR